MEGRGQMLAGAEEREAGRNTLLFVPPSAPHAIRNTGDQPLAYVSATAPPFEAAVTGQTWEIRR